MKKILILLLFPLSVYAQLNGTFKSIRFTPAQDTTILNLTPSQYPIGTVIREINTDTLYYKFPSGYWRPLVGSGGGGVGSITADNGLTASSNNVQLGGSLIQNTTVTGGGFNLSLGTFGSRANIFRAFAIDAGLHGEDVTIQADGSPASINLISRQRIILQHINDNNTQLATFLKQQSSNNSIPSPIVEYVVTSSSGGDTGFGMDFDYVLSSSTGPTVIASRDRYEFTDAITGTEDISYIKNIVSNGSSVEVLRIESLSTGDIYYFMPQLITDCTGAPSGALANISGTVTVCP